MMLPLQGKRIVVTRAAHQATALIEAIVRLGGEPLRCPVIRTIPVRTPATAQVIERISSHVHTYDFLLLTSENACVHFMENCTHYGVDLTAWRRLRVATVGPKTADIIRQAGWDVSVVPEKTFSGAGLAQALVTMFPSPLRCIVPRAHVAQTTWMDTLRLAGHHLCEWVVYETVADPTAVACITDALDTNTIDAITFTSPSTALRLYDHLTVAQRQRVATIPLVCIGETTASAVRTLGWDVYAVAPEATIESLVQTLCTTWT